MSYEYNGYFERREWTDDMAVRLPTIFDSEQPPIRGWVYSSSKPNAGVGWVMMTHDGRFDCGDMLGHFSSLEKAERAMDDWYIQEGCKMHGHQLEQLNRVANAFQAQLKIVVTKMIDDATPGKAVLRIGKCKNRPLIAVALSWMTEDSTKEAHSRWEVERVVCRADELEVDLEDIARLAQGKGGM